MEILRERRIIIFLLQVCGTLSGGGCGCVRLKIFGSGIKGMVSGYINCVSKADIRNPLRYLLMNAVASRSAFIELREPCRYEYWMADITESARKFQTQERNRHYDFK